MRRAKQGLLLLGGVILMFALPARSDAEPPKRRSCRAVLDSWSSATPRNQRVLAADLPRDVSRCLRQPLEEKTRDEEMRFVGLRWAAPIGLGTHAIAVSYYERTEPGMIPLGYWMFAVLQRGAQADTYVLAKTLGVSKYAEWMAGDSSLRLLPPRDCDGDGAPDLAIRWGESFEGDGSKGELCLGSRGELVSKSDSTSEPEEEPEPEP